VGLPRRGDASDREKQADFGGHRAGTFGSRRHARRELREEGARSDVDPLIDPDPDAAQERCAGVRASRQGPWAARIRACTAMLRSG